ncbi:arylsulfatase [Flavobacterium sp. LS1R49]|uniref:Arylsulfatase n=1 Tax=Flavobacterium shii TaxID=2987687 RepID=A0A9X2ZHU3_9FLAO|nr:arylsulfatase [Flavobacterium shii]MCV9927953.1 arylsulfatase [Flavobacterium shii]
MKKLKITVLFLGLLSISSIDLKAQSKPNVIVIMTDDVGWGDLGSYGGGVMRGAPTPNLDRMAAEGARFVNYYGQSSCTAGRASFITGRIPVRSALSAVLVPGDPNGLTKETPTIAEAMKKAGYSTMFVGKWHLGDKDENYPIAHGYDEMYHMLPYYAGVYAYDDKTLHPNFPSDDAEFLKVWNSINLGEFEGKAGQKAKVIKQKVGYADLATVDDEMREATVDYIKKHAKDNKPFFATVCFEKVHNPNNPSPRWKGKSPGGGNYLDALMEMDDNSGQIIEAVRDAGIENNTLIIWTTDNGAWVDAWPDAGYTPFRGMKGSVYEGGFRVPALAWWPGHIKPGSVNTDMFSHMDWWPTIASIIAQPVPTHDWKDNNGSPIIFDGLDLSASLLGKGPGVRQDFYYFAGQAFGAVRVKNFKFLFTAKDSWLGSDKPLKVVATYDLLWDPAEHYDMTFNGAAPDNGNSPGHFSGSDNGWAGMYMAPRVMKLFEEMKKVPNKKYIPFGEGLTKLIPDDYK